MKILWSGPFHLKVNQKQFSERKWLIKQTCKISNKQIYEKKFITL